VTGYFTVPCFTAANVQWRFARPGMAFSTDKDTYKTTKAGATISFTAEGTKLDGFEKTEKTLK
jgi:hypothetical protein